jgi:hypothetical protein
MKLRPSLARAHADLDASAFSVLSEDEWRALCEVFGDAIECAIDHAAVRSGSDSDDVDALEHLRHVARASLAGRAIAADTCRLLHAVGILLATLAEPSSEGEASERRLSIVGGRVRQLAGLAREASRTPRAPSLVEVRPSASDATDRVRPARRTSTRRASSLSVAA